MPKHTKAKQVRRHAPVPGGKKALSRKTAKVKRHQPSLTKRQAVGKAAGILRGSRKKR